MLKNCAESAMKQIVCRLSVLAAALLAVPACAPAPCTTEIRAKQLSEVIRERNPKIYAKDATWWGAPNVFTGRSHFNRRTEAVAVAIEAQDWRSLQRALLEMSNFMDERQVAYERSLEMTVDSLLGGFAMAGSDGTSADPSMSGAATDGVSMAAGHLREQQRKANAARRPVPTAERPIHKAVCHLVFDNSSNNCVNITRAEFLRLVNQPPSAALLNLFVVGEIPENASNRHCLRSPN